MTLTHKVWRVWKYALGSFSDTETAKYDNAVCIVRSTIFITYLITNCFITAGVIRHWNPMTDKPLKPGSYIDTQGMGGPMTPEDLAKWKASPEYKKQVHKPMVVRPRRLFTPEYVKEMKILINEILDEREYKKRMKGEYDIGGYELPPSYFDSEHFKHYVGEDEPPYVSWEQP